MTQHSQSLRKYISTADGAVRFSEKPLKHPWIEVVKQPVVPQLTQDMVNAALIRHDILPGHTSKDCKHCNYIREVLSK